MPVIGLVQLAKAWDKPEDSFDSPEQAEEWKDISVAAVLENMVLRGQDPCEVFEPNEIYETTEEYRLAGRRILIEAVFKYDKKD